MRVSSVSGVWGMFESGRGQATHWACGVCRQRNGKDQLCWMIGESVLKPCGRSSSATKDGCASHSRTASWGLSTALGLLCAGLCTFGRRFCCVAVVGGKWVTAHQTSSYLRDRVTTVCMGDAMVRTTVRFVTFMRWIVRGVSDIPQETTVSIVHRASALTSAAHQTAVRALCTHPHPDLALARAWRSTSLTYSASARLLYPRIG